MLNNGTELIVSNPLADFRRSVGLTQRELAAECGIHWTIVQLQENGIPHHIHPKMLKRFPGLTELIPKYHEYRVAVRRFNFLPGPTPTNGPAFVSWLREHKIFITEFSELACMPIPDIQKAIHSWNLPVTIVRFFEEINDTEDD